MKEIKFRNFKKWILNMNNLKNHKKICLKDAGPYWETLIDIEQIRVSIPM